MMPPQLVPCHGSVSDGSVSLPMKSYEIFGAYVIINRHFRADY